MEGRKGVLPGSGVLGSVKWWWVLATGAGAGLLSCLLLFPVISGYVLIASLLKRGAQSAFEQFVYAYAAWGMPTIHMLLVVFAASWLARKVGTAAVTHGVLTALVSVVVTQGIFTYLSPPFELGEAVTYLAMATAGGLLGGAEGRSVLVGQEALYRVSRDISAARDPQDVLAAIHVYLSDSATIGEALWQPPGRTGEDSSNGSDGLETWRPWFSRHWPEGVGFEGLDVLALAGSGRPASWTLRAGRLSAPKRRAWRQKGVRSVLLLPLVAPAGGTIGLLAVASRKRRIPRSTIRACLTIGVQVALALENLRLVEEARKAGVLRERQRMAHEIHDTLAQGFTSIVMNLEAAEGVIYSNLDRTQHHLDQARLTARESLTEARRLVWALRPEALESASSLPEALGSLVERWSAQSGISAGFSTTGTPCPLPSEVEAMLFRVAQEALNNARKHARGASRVALTLSYMGDVVTLDARDDGAGFDPSRELGKVRDSESGGFGLRGMRERVEGVGGALSVESAPGEGTTLAVELPAAACIGPSSSSSRSEGSPRDVEVP